LKEFNMRLLLFILILSGSLVAGCGQPPTPMPTPTLTPEELQAAIFVAAREDDIEAMKRLIAAGADINEGGEFSVTVLAIAAQRGNVEMVRLLLDEGAAYDVQIFHAAVLNSGGDTQIVQAFIEHGVDIDEPEPYAPAHTALMLAAEHGYLEIGRLLIENGADINKLAQFNDPALNIAAAHGQFEFVKMLVENGAQLNFRGFENRTALGYALHRGHDEIAAYLIAAGATE
jgi:uncharacterized protein